MLTGHWEVGTEVACTVHLLLPSEQWQTELFGGPKLSKLRFSGLG